MATILSYQRLNDDDSTKKGYALAGVSSTRAGDDFVVAQADMPFDPAVGDKLKVMDVGESVKTVTAVAEVAPDWTITAS